MGREHILLAGIGLALGLQSCATERGANSRGDAAGLVAALRDEPPAVDRGALVVRLAFGAAADLDLYVTDPLGETVYFANTPSRSGGALAADRVCGEPAPRIESVVFEHPAAGRYRVGVDHPTACDGGAGAAAFAVDALSEGRRIEQHGAIALRRFEPVVLEIDVGPSPGD